jgi:hypothetical protein
MSNKVVIEITPETALKSWHNLQIALREFDEDNVRSMLEREIAGRKRPDFIKRIHQRLGKLQRSRQREELLDECNDS